MMLLTQVAEIGELHKLKILFEANGILIHVGNEDSARNYGYFHPSGRYALFAVLEEQYQDAELLLENSSHVVTSSVDLEKIKVVEEEQKSNVMEAMLNNIMTAALVMFFVVLFVLWFMHD